MYKKAKLRCFKFRKKILDLSQKVSALHIGGSFSSVEIIDAIYNIVKRKRDKFILSKGHVGILQYVVLNYLKILSEKQLRSYCQVQGTLGVHPEINYPGIEASTGSLGHGLAMACGMALASRDTNIYLISSDGELMEGSVWESVLSISSLNLKNIIYLIDNNDLQSATRASETHKPLYPIHKKFQSFGWESTTCNGHSSQEIVKKIKSRKNKKPYALICRTIKGYPISFMKNVPYWHYRSPNESEYKKALNELKKMYEK